MRQLLHIPIVHGHAEMGSARNEVRRAHVACGGENAWEKSRRVIAELWHAIEKAMDSLHLDYRKARLYQDGLPLCGLEDRIVRDLAARGIVNYRILLKLIDRGATLEGTEDPGLLRTEHALITKTAPGPAHAAGAGDGARAAQLYDLLDQRDRFIAQRIDATLRRGETGILFLGALHHAVEKLPDSVEVVSLQQMLRRQVVAEKNDG